ncbi:hypothetical protein KBG31_00005 [Patescibacteria group bacterium]|nr:hypothetical protein [Patescibacteria group bacterium]
MQQPIDLLTNPPILFLVIIWTLSWKGVALWMNRLRNIGYTLGKMLTYETNL